MNIIAVCTRKAMRKDFSPHMIRGVFGNALTWLGLFGRVYSEYQSPGNRLYGHYYETFPGDEQLQQDSLVKLTLCHQHAYQASALVYPD
jgi:hypothetical protein